MKERYSRNRLYVLPEEQDIISQKRILLGGAGIGSIIAECAIRFGFEKMTIVDGDVVEESNLNRQNYCDNLVGLIEGHDIAINALDFNSDIPFALDEECRKRDIPVLHPYNFGWAGFLTIVSPHGEPITVLSNNPSGFELKMANYVTQYCAFWQNPKNWLQNIIERYGKEVGNMPPPQLSVGSWIAAGYCVNAMYRLSTSKEVHFFPNFYLSASVNE